MKNTNIILIIVAVIAAVGVLAGGAQYKLADWSSGGDTIDAGLSRKFAVNAMKISGAILAILLVVLFFVNRKK